MLTILISMIIFALIGAMTPGPVNIIAAGSGANYGFKKTLSHVMGATIAYTLVVFLMGIGLNQILTLYPQINTTTQYLGAAFLLYMSYKIATANPINTDIITKKTAPPTLIEGFLAQALNPKAWLVSMSGVSLFVLPNSPPFTYLMIFCSVSFSMCFIGVSTWAAIGQLIGRFLSTPKRQVAFNITMGLLLSATVVSILLNK